MASTTNETNYVRRGLGLVLGCSPLVLLCGSVLYGLSHGGQLRAAGLVAELLALLVAGLNFYLSFVRGALHERRKGSREGYRHVSGLPMIGTLLVVLGVFLGFGSIGSSVLGIVSVAADTGGSVWLLVATWRDTSLWDAPS